MKFGFYITILCFLVFLIGTAGIVMGIRRHDPMLLGYGSIIWNITLFWEVVLLKDEVRELREK